MTTESVLTEPRTVTSRLELSNLLALGVYCFIEFSGGRASDYPLAVPPSVTAINVNTGAMIVEHRGRTVMLFNDPAIVVKTAG